MRRRDLSLTVALCASLTVHALLSRALVDRFVAENRQIRLAGAPVESSVTSELVKPAITPPTLEFDLGDPDAKGTALDSAPGEKPMRARQGDQDQAFGRVDPPGTHEPAPPKQTLAHMIEMEQRAMATLPQKAPFGIGPSRSEREAPTPRVIPAPNPAPSPDKSGKVAVAPRAGEPAPQLPSETDPFAKAGSVKFERGRTDVQFGRKHKLIRPRFDLAVQQDLLAMRFPITLVLKLRLDGDGNVAAADVEKSSGSTVLDHAVKITAFKWWFEPKKSKEASPDEFLFTIRFL
ncbi:MAG TPA: TonB family protein [Tepidisphaeraceae bacterium]|jgi:TonB family protein|nr:TonB family protein [Tepidisphaeraceae bacterium]